MTKNVVANKKMSSFLSNGWREFDEGSESVVMLNLSSEDKCGTITYYLDSFSLFQSHVERS